MSISAKKLFILGVISTLLGGTLWGFSGACLQKLFSLYEISSLFITAARMIGSGLVFLIILFITKRQALKEIFTTPKILGQFAIFGICGLFFCQITYIMTIQYTNAGTATVLQNTGTVFIMLATCILTKKLPALRDFLGLILALVATVLIATQGDLTTLAVPPEGLFWGLLCGASVMMYVMYPKKLLQRYGALTVTGLGMAFGGVAAGLLCVGSFAIGQPIAIPALDIVGIELLLCVIVLGTIVAFTLYIEGVSIVGPVKGGLLGAIEPVSATVFCALWLGTTFTGFDIAGLIMMIGMVILVSGKEEKGQHDQKSSVCKDAQLVEQRDSEQQ